MVAMPHYVVFAPVVGDLAHKFSRKPFLVAMDLCRVVCVLAMPFVTAYLKTPRLGGSASEVAMAMAAAGGGSMLAALLLPGVLERIPDRTVMLAGGWVMAIGVAMMAMRPGMAGVLVIWFVIGIGWSLVQTPAGPVVNRSAAPVDRPAYFSAQFALTHACWLLFYLLAGFSGTSIGFAATATLSALGIAIFTLIATCQWPGVDTHDLAHYHSPVWHKHAHRRHKHNLHHNHAHKPAGEQADTNSELHSHWHQHPQQQHIHAFAIDDHHSHWPSRRLGPR
jgi:hypothetical protein